MPYRVANFLRSATHPLEKRAYKLKKSVIKSAHRRRSRSPCRTPQQPSRRYRGVRDGSAGEIAEEEESDPAPFSRNMTPRPSPDHLFKSEEHHHLRLTFPGIHFGRSNKESHLSGKASLRWQVESPPVVFLGSPENSTGALVSGQLYLDTREDKLDVKSLEATLRIHVTHKKPFAVNCPGCQHQYTELNKWKFLQQPVTFKRGEHTFPFSILLQGHHPASTEGQLVNIAYEFKAVAQLASGAQLKLDRVLPVKRSMPEAETAHHSIRVFPPTDIQASMYYPDVIHPIGFNTLKLQLTGISKQKEGKYSHEYWKLKKLTWRLEETATALARPCATHQNPLRERETAAAKGLVRSETRIIGEQTIFSGWKNNYTAHGEASVDIELEYAPSLHARFECDNKAYDGVEVTHQLMLEMLVSQEWAPLNKPTLVTQTGLGRILRMRFGTVLTERGGIGISWDNESPPIYQDVPPSPPSYEDAASHKQGFTWEETALERL